MCGSDQHIPLCRKLTGPTLMLLRISIEGHPLESPAIILSFQVPYSLRLHTDKDSHIIHTG